MAVEDAAVLGNLLSRIANIAELTPLLRGYEVIRHARTAATQADSRLNQKINHYHDGPEQEERDRQMRLAMEIELKKLRAEERGEKIDFSGEGNSNQWADRPKSMEQFGYDADIAAEKWWSEKGERICKQAVAYAACGPVSNARL